MDDKVTGRVLVVDDDPAIRISLWALLAEDFDVLTANDAEAAAEILDREPVDVLLTDYAMPGMNGAELLKRIRALHPAVVGVMLTGHGAHQEVRRAALDSEIFAVILKPYDPAALITRVRQAIGIAQLRRSRLPAAARKAPRL